MNNPQTPNPLPPILLLLAMLGVSAATGTFVYQVTKDPWQAFGLAVLCELLMVGIGFATQIWRQLQNRWINQITDWLDVKVQILFSGYRRRYLGYLVNQHWAFDVKGLTTQGPYTLALERVFVQLRVEPQPLHETSSNPIRVVPEELREGNHAIWDYLRQMADQNVVIIGPPGSGKTTLLKYMTLTLAESKKEWRRVSVPGKIPILLFLRDHVDAIKANSEISLAQLMQDRLAKLNGPPAPPNWFKSHLAKGHCLVMLDGLDEVADPQARKDIVNWVERQMKAYGESRFIVTSRPHGYRSNILEGVTVLEVCHFNTDQVQRFVHNWYLENEIRGNPTNETGARLSARQGAEDLLRRLRNTPALYDMAVNPLLLTMIATVHRYRSTLPGRRVELYAEICEVFLGKLHIVRGLAPDLTPSQKQSVLQSLAYHMMNHRQLEIPLAEALAIIREPLELVKPWESGEDFLMMIENGSGLLLQREAGVYAFAHKTFQEYLAAVYIKDKGLEHYLQEQVEDAWWNETIRLYTAQADASTIIKACLTGEIPTVSALTLAIQCLNEAQKVQPTVRAEVMHVLTQGIEDADPERRSIIADALLTLHLSRMIRVDDDRYIDNSLISHAEYQLFLDEQQMQGRFYHPEHWSDDRFPPGQGHAPVVGVRPTDAVAFCEWLTQHVPDAWSYRLPDATEPDATPALDDALAELKASVGYWVNSDAGMHCITMEAVKSVLVDRTLQRWFNYDLDHAREHDPVFEVARNHKSARDIVSLCIRTRKVSPQRFRVSRSSLTLHWTRHNRV
jgi:energy-coupling factor transporter ATP-binding protein EcfA2